MLSHIPPFRHTELWDVPHNHHVSSLSGADVDSGGQILVLPLPELCDLGQGTKSLCASVSTSIKLVLY